MSTEYEVIIGLEVHVQLATESKVFSSARSRLATGTSVADEAVNQNTNEVCSAQPGSLPVLNERAIEFAVKAGLATGCRINERSVFSRKHYFYPDLPKGYQISQYDLPICEHGFLNIELGDTQKRIGITRIHMEEDAGKLVHLSGFSLVNLNRAGVPLIEVVSEPDMRSSAEAGAYLRKLYAIVTALGVCDGNLQEGNFRCDANVSIRPKGQEKFGTRTETKNVNSFRFVEKAIEFEIARQKEVLESGGRVIQETRLYDSVKDQTFSMRSKEEAQDYRYFPDPDLPPLVLDPSYIENIRKSLPELPDQKRDRYVASFGLSKYDAEVLTGSSALSAYFEEALAFNNKNAKALANLITGELARLLNDSEKEISAVLLRPKHVADLARCLQEQIISMSAAKQILSVIFASGGEVEALIESLGLRQVSDLSALDPVIDEVIAKNPKQVEEFRSGKDKLLGFFVGQVMKATGGKANPGLLQEQVLKKLKG